MPSTFLVFTRPYWRRRAGTTKIFCTHAVSDDKLYSVLKLLDPRKKLVRQNSVSIFFLQNQIFIYDRILSDDA